MTTPSVWFSPAMNESQFLDNNGNVASGYYIQQYEAGSFSVYQSTYSDNTGLTPNANPIQLDSSGRLPAGVSLWLDSTKTYNLVLTTDYDGINVIRYFDNVSGVPIISSSGSGSSVVWIQTTTPTYVGSGQFLVSGNYTTQYAAGNRYKLQYSDMSFYYGTVLSSTFSGGNTYITVQTDSGSLSPSMTTAWYSANSSYVEGATVDAGGVTFTSGLTYTVPGTVGYKLTQAATAISNISTDIAGLYLAWATTGGGSIYALSPTPASLGNSYNQSYNVVFNAASSGSATLNVSGQGAAPLVQLNSSGSYVAATIYTGMTTQVIYNGSQWVVQSPAPTPAAAAGSAYWSYFNTPNIGAGTAIIANYQSSSITAVGVSSYSSGRVTVANTGIYDIQGSLTGQPQSSNGVLNLYVNGAATGIQSNGQLFNFAEGYFNFIVGGIIQLNAGDIVDIRWTSGNGTISGDGFFKGLRIA
jgi:hypothetical protein